MTAGLFHAAPETLRKGTRATRGTVLSMLSRVLKFLTSDTCPVAVAQLVAHNGVELAVDYVTEAGLDIPELGLDIFEYFFRDRRARERVCGPVAADQLVQWAAKWLPLVSGMVIR